MEPVPQTPAHRSRTPWVGVSGHLDLGNAITTAQRDFAATLIASTLGVAGNAKALKNESGGPYVDDGRSGACCRPVT